MANIYTFTEHCFTVSGEKDDLLHLAELLRYAEGTLGDLRYQIEVEFNIDNINEDTMEDIDLEFDALDEAMQ